MPWRRKAKPDLPDLTGLVVLVVDDNPDTVEALTAVLDACGGHALQAGTGTGALAHLETAPKLHAIVTDLAMPDMTGVDLLTRVRAHPRRKNLPIIAITGFYKDYADAKGFDAFLRKPLDYDKLCTTIRTLVA